jgi:hypothetical protein
MSLISYQESFSRLRLNRRAGHSSPHKVAMLLAVMELIETEQLSENRIYFDEPLRELFTRHFAAHATHADQDSPHLPFFHLRSSGFWHHRVKAGAEAEYDRLGTVSGPGQVVRTVSFAYLDEELFELLGFSPSRLVLRDSLLQSLSPEDVSSRMTTSGWSWFECEVLVADYFAMLEKELRGEAYSKTTHRNALISQLKERNKGSIEFKHQNVSAILVELGEPYIKGYKPRFNYQSQLISVVKAHIGSRRIQFEALMSAFADSAPEKTPVDWEAVLDQDIPERIAEVREPVRAYKATRISFAAREAANRKLGERGERFALDFERSRLGALLRGDLADRVEWRSREQGDGLGYDILSFDAQSGEERFLEVKTTNSGKYFPFYLSRNELDFSRQHTSQYSLYRVFDFSDQARLFALDGAIDEHVNLEPSVYKAGFR